MVHVLKGLQGFGTSAIGMKRRRRVASLLILIADAGLLVWGAMAALAPNRLQDHVPHPS